MEDIYFICFMDTTYNVIANHFVEICHSIKIFWHTFHVICVVCRSCLISLITYNDCLIMLIIILCVCVLHVVFLVYRHCRFLPPPWHTYYIYIRRWNWFSLNFYSPAGIGHVVANLFRLKIFIFVKVCWAKLRLGLHEKPCRKGKICKMLIDASLFPDSDHLVETVACDQRNRVQHGQTVNQAGVSV